MQFPETPLSTWLPKLEGGKLYEEHLLATQDKLVRGAYVYKQQAFLIEGQTLNLGYYRLPMSEGLVDSRFASVGVQLMLDALRKNPLLYILGIGSTDDPITKMLRAGGWSIGSIPFYFRVHRPARFLRNIVYLRTSRLRRVALDLLAFSGLGTLAVGAYQALKTRKRRSPRTIFQVAEEATFGPWADAVWQGGQADYSMVAVRDAASLNILYPPGSPFIRLRVESGGQTVGWASLLNTQMRTHNFFGAMRLGSLVDCLALPGHEASVMAATSDYLRQAGADLTVTNLSHRKWCAAAEGAGFLQGPSNFLFAAAKKLAERLSPFDQESQRVHLMRADGDGPEALLGDRPA